MDVDDESSKSKDEPDMQRHTFCVFTVSGERDVFAELLEADAQKQMTREMNRRQAKLRGRGAPGQQGTSGDNNSLSLPGSANANAFYTALCSKEERDRALKNANRKKLDEETERPDEARTKYLFFDTKLA
ncbi:unnamed protein product, partial [Amoebophrya sp. A25]